MNLCILFYVVQTFIQILNHDFKLKFYLCLFIVNYLKANNKYNNLIGFVSWKLVTIIIYITNN